MSNILITLKKRLVWVFLDIEEIRDKHNDTGLKEGGGIEMSTTVLFHIHDCTFSFAFEDLPNAWTTCVPLAINVAPRYLFSSLNEVSPIKSISFATPINLGLAPSLGLW